MLSKIVKDHQRWQSFGRPFMQQAWPRERNCQASSVSSQLTWVALAAGDDFPDAVQALLPVLAPVDQIEMLLYAIGTEGTGNGGRSFPERFPEPVLTLLDRIVPQNAPPSAYGLDSLLKTIAVADPSLRQDPRWRRLESIVSRQ
jgi:hypothetical protein